jgi:hypothetical protein
MNKIRFTVLAALILSAAASRLIPHPPNFAPIGAIALFGGAQFASKRTAFLVPLLAMLLSDLVLGFHTLMPVVYGSFALTVALGFWVRLHRSGQRIAFAAIASAISFFVITNFGVWAISHLYPRTLVGLTECYVAAIPYFQNMLAGNLLYSTLLFGGFALAEKRFAGLRESTAGAV